MNPQEKAQFEELKRKVEMLERKPTLDLTQNIKERLYKDSNLFPNSSLYSGSQNATEAKLQDITVGMSSITVLGAPDRFLLVDYNGKILQVPCYLR